MKKSISILVSIISILNIFSCKLAVLDDINSQSTSLCQNFSDDSDVAQDEVVKSIKTTKVESHEKTTDCNIQITDLGAWQNSVNIPAKYFAEMSVSDYVIISTETNYSNDERQLQINYAENANSITAIGSYDSLSDANYLGEWKCYTLYSANQETKFYPTEGELSVLKKYGLLIKGKGVKVTAVKVYTVTYDELEIEIDENQQTVVPVNGVVDCEIQTTDLGAWQNSVAISKEYFGAMNFGDYLVISTQKNYSNDECQLQVNYVESEDKVTTMGSYGSLSDTNYLGEWKCYTLYSGNQDTKFTPTDGEIENLKNFGLLIKGKGVKVTSVKVYVAQKEETPVEDTPVVETPTEETPSNNDENSENQNENPVETPEENTPEPVPEEKPQENVPVDNGEDTIPRLIHDCKLAASDLGDAWEWSKKVDLDASHFVDMESGDFIIITTAESETSKIGTLPQIKLGANVNWNLQILGNAASCTNVEYYNNEYNTYTLKAASQTTRFSPSDSEIEKIVKNGLVIQGQGVTVTKVTVHTKDYSAENPNIIGDSTGVVYSTLSDPKATNNAKRLYNFIKANYGKKVITGQMENAWDNSFKQLDKVYEVTGKYPALMGFDFINYNVDWAIESNFNVQTERAINFWNGKDYKGKKISNSNGIVTFCWHWKDPMRETTNESYKPEELNFRIPYDLGNDAWKTSTPEYKAMMRDLDYVAAELLRLQEAGVPVIWRPLHEGAGNVGVYNGGAAWFWWGAGTSKSDATNEANCAKAYIALWQLMYKYFTETKGIHNLIWLWNGQNEKFYPGDKYVDMLGDDIYRQKNYDAHKADFDRFQSVNSNLPLALSECGTVPSLSNMKNQNAMWSFFMVWNDANNFGSGSDNFWSSEDYNPRSHKIELYNSPLAITLDDVGDLTNY